MFFKHSVFSNRTPPTPQISCRSPRFKTDQNHCSGKMGVRSCSELYAALTELRLLRKWCGKCSSNINLTGSQTVPCQLLLGEGTWCPGYSLVVWGVAGGKGCIRNSCTPAPELVGTAFMHVSSLFLRSCALMWARTTQRHCLQTLGLLFLDGPLFTHSSAGGGWNIPLWFCGSGAAG